MALEPNHLLSLTTDHQCPHCVSACVQVTDKAAAAGRTKRDNGYMYETFMGGLAADTIYGFEQALGVVNDSWKKP